MGAYSVKSGFWYGKFSVIMVFAWMIYGVGWVVYRVNFF